MKINISVFDLLGAILPGIPFLLSFFILNNFSPLSLDTFNLLFQQLTMVKTASIIIASYFIGFLMQYPSYEFFKFLLPKWGKKRTMGFEISIGKRGKEISKIRSNSKENYKTLESFLALRIMCYNSFFSLFVFILIDIFLIFITECKTETILILIFIIVLMVLSLRRAVSFHEWAQNIITDSVELIKSSNNTSDEEIND